MAKMSWKKAVERVLLDADESMHYTSIADEITERKLVKTVGATPANTVNSTIAVSLRDDKGKSPFERVGRGLYTLRNKKDKRALRRKNKSEDAEEIIRDVEEETGLINAFGMYWSRNKVFWQSKPKLLGYQNNSDETVDFSNQIGVYLLFDGRNVVYVGKASQESLGKRLSSHTKDRLSGRWNRFSWFGIYQVTSKGRLNEEQQFNFTPGILLTTIEAVLIEGLEPPQNRKRGDDFKAIEFLQRTDDRITKRLALLESMEHLA